MRNKSIVLLAIALGCGMIASVGISQVVMNGGSTAAPAMVEILVASKDIPRDAKITADNILLEKWPEGKSPEGALTDIAELEDKYAKQYIYAGEALLRQKVVDATERKTVGITAGHTLVTYNISNDPGIGNLIEPGDRVNVIGFFEKSELVPETTHRDIFRNIKIFAIDGRTSKDPENKPSGSPSTVVLEINKEDERAWNWAQKFGSLRLTLGNQSDFDEVDSDMPNPAAQELMRWIEDERSRREAEAAAGRAGKPQPVEEGGGVMVMMTPTGLKTMRWNEATRTFKVIEDYTSKDTVLGEEQGSASGPAAGSGQPSESSPAGPTDPEEWQEQSFRLNRAR